MPKAFISEYVSITMPEKRSRSTLEAYGGIVLTAVSIIFPLVWWIKAIIACAVAYIAVDVVRRSQWTVEYKAKRKNFLCVLAVALVAAVSWRPIVDTYRDQKLEAFLQLYYQGLKLDGKTIALTKSIDPTSEVQPRMFIDPNNLSNFSLSGISVRNDGPLPAEVYTAHLEFPFKVSQVGSSCWQQENVEGTKFICDWNKYLTTSG